MGVSRPSARIRLQIRLDEGTDQSKLVNSMQRTSVLAGTSVLDTASASLSDVADALSDNQAERRVVQGAADLLSPTDVADRLSRLGSERDRLQSAFGGTKSQQRPDGLVFGASDDLVVLGSFMPRKVKIKRNSIREADECEVTLDLRDAPIDPRMVRAVFIDVTMGIVSPQDFERGVTGGKGGRRADGSPLSVIEAPRGQELVYRSATRFVGFGEQWTETLENQGDRIVIRARDLTAMLLAPRFIPDGGGIDLNLPIREGVQKLINSFEATRGLRVFYGNPKPGDNFGGSDQGPVPSDATPKALWTRKGKKNTRKRTGQDRVSVWDHITDVCVGMGLTPMIRGFHLFLVQPRTFFAGRSEPIRMAYGQNLGGWKLERKFAREKVPTIQVRAYDPQIGRSRWGQWPVPDGGKTSGVFGIDVPPKPQRPNDVSPGGKSAETVSVYTVRGINDGKTLAEAARSIYEQVGRREIDGTIDTHEVTSLPSDDPRKPAPIEGDLLNLQAGDPIEAVVSPLNAATNGDATDTQSGGAFNSAQELATMAPGRRSEYLQALGYGRKAAEQIAEAYERISLLKVFRVHSADICWEHDKGIDISIGFQNFLVVREAKDSGEQSETDAVAGLTAGSDSLASKALRAASAAGVTAGSRGASGAITPSSFEEDSGEASRDQRSASRAERKGG